jgi:hypothetical protein
MSVVADPRDGALRFARFAYPPNSLGLCGPSDSVALLEQASSRISDGGLRQLARGFAGAWPYLELIATANHFGDPLDARVVEAYWIGNGLLDRVGASLLGGSLDARFRKRAGGNWSALSESLQAGARPHHNFHVFSVYPWVGLLERGHTGEPLHILDRCRIRWGQVDQVVDDRVLVRSAPLVWTGHALALGAAQPESVAWQSDGHALTAAPHPGDWVAMHWDWLCEALTSLQLQALRAETAQQLALANNRVAHPGPAAVLA